MVSCYKLIYIYCMCKYFFSVVFLITMYILKKKIGKPVDLVRKMLERNVSERLSINQVLEHEWLKS